MAIFNELATDLMILNEKKTQEEYARRRFKEKYNFEPDKPGSNTGTITDKAGKKYKVDMKPGKMDAGMGVEIDTPTSAEIYGDNAKDSKINLDKNFFKIKGSHKGERRDAMLQHEIGHHNLHNTHAENKTVDKKNRTMEVYKNVVSGSVKDNLGADISSDEDVDQIAYGDNAHESRKQINDQGETAKHYAKKLGSKEERKQRNADLEVAKHYEKKSPHANAAEYEADRFAANRTSEKAIKKGVRNAYKLARKGYDKTFDDVTDGYGDEDDRKEFKKNMNNAAEVDMKQRSKALKDDAMRKAKSYK